jgi:alkylation response protein AidB-like acyl-CoA dehydrogenase
VTTSPTAPRILADAALHEQITRYCGERAQDIDACRASLRDGLAHLATLGVVHTGVLGRDDAASFERFCEVVATVALEDMSQAFSLWAHRMAIEYLEQSDSGCALRADLLPRVATAEVIGSTSFASATANFLAGAPLPLTYREQADGTLLVSGRIPWASNLEAPFLSVAAAANADDPEQRVVFAYSDQTPGLTLPAYPQILALQSTNSTSPLFEDAVITTDCVLTREFTTFVPRILATFLLIQASFCWGLTRRALGEAEALLGGQRDVLREDFETLDARARDAEATLRRLASTPDRAAIPSREVLALRLEWGRLTVEAVALEAKLAGGRGYMLNSGTARRYREAAFLPVQAPTEIQLRWLLSHSE